MSLYLWINVLSLLVPLIVSFHPKIKLYQQWYYLFPVLLFSMLPFIVWDVYFTEMGYWGFNEKYLSDISFMHLPLGEWLFFITIPYACIFTHVSILKINPNWALKPATVQRISKILLVLFVLTAVKNFSLAYTLVDMICAIVILIMVLVFQPKLLQTFFITFLFMLIPFFIVNGILTGTGIDQEVVWYNDAENMGIRFFTIPIEDIVYAFSLILLNMFLFDLFKRKYSNIKKTNKDG